VTTWWRVTCWRGLAETVNQYLSKGRQVFVEGRVQGEASDGTVNPRVWQGNDGSWRASFEITAQTVKFLAGREEASTGPSLGEPPPERFDEGELPF
jgi:single-strand DNA-binding protein